jgi:uncharacterized protein DUF4412
MKFYPALVLTVAVLATPAALCAAAFEGKVRMKMSDSRGNAHELDYRVKAGFVRMDMEAAKGQTASVIMDLGKKEMIILIPGQNIYMTRSIPDTTAAAARSSDKDATFEKTGETAKILGYDCVKYVYKSKDVTSEIWGTEELGRFMGLGSNANPMGGRRAAQAGPAWEKMLMGKDFFPLRVVTQKAKGSDQFNLEATAVTKESEPDSVFQPPAGYQKFDLGGMMRGMGFPTSRH